jgi:hypothetical protein
MQDVLLELPGILKSLLFDSQLTLQLIHHSGVLVAAQCLTNTAQHNTAYNSVVSTKVQHRPARRALVMITASPELVNNCSAMLFAPTAWCLVRVASSDAITVTLAVLSPPAHNVCVCLIAAGCRQLLH